MLSKKVKIYIVVSVSVVVFIALLFFNKKKKIDNLEMAQIVENLPTSIKVERVKKESVGSRLEVVGTTVGIKDVIVISETQGKIGAVNTKVGRYVNEGSVLVEVDDELKTIAMNVSKINYEKAKKDADRYNDLYEEKSVTETQYEGVKLAMMKAEMDYFLAKRQLDDTKIKSPISGIVSSFNLEKGEMLSVGAVVANIVDLSFLKVVFWVDERSLFSMHEGDNVEIKTDVYSTVSYSGKIISVGSKADLTHNYPVEVLFENKRGNGLKAGMFVRGKFEVEATASRIVVPASAVFGDSKSPFVFIHENGVARYRKVTTGEVIENRIEVVSGIEDGEEVITQGVTYLKDGDMVTIQ